MIMSSPFYRGAAISLFLAGLGISATNPQLSLFLVGDLGASLPVAGLFYLTNLTAPAVGYAIGVLSDRRRDRLPLFRVGAVLGFVGWGAMAFSTQVWVAFAINLTVLSVAGATGALIYAAVRDELSRRPTAMDNRVMSTIRMAFSVGFVMGPVFGSVFGGVFGLRAMLAATGVCSLLQILPLIRTRVVREVQPRPARTSWRERRRSRRSGSAIERPVSMAPLLVFLGLGVLAMCGDTVKFAYLPIYMERDLGTPDVLRGAVISTQSLGMLVFIPVVGYLADRFDPRRLVIIGTIFGAAGNLGFFLSGSVVGLVISTLLMSVLWAAIGGLGVSVAQNLYPTGVGVASSLYFSAIRFSAAVGGLVGGLGVAALGIPGVFAVPAVLTVIAFVGLTVQAVVTRPRA